MLVLRPRVRGLRHPEPPTVPAVVALVGRPELLATENLEGVVRLDVVHDRSDAAPAGQCHRVQADVDVLIHQPPIGKSHPFAVDEAEERVGVLQTFAVPPGNLRMDSGSDHVVEVVILLHDALHVAHHGRGFLEGRLADVHRAAVLEGDSGTGPGWNVHRRRLQQRLDLAHAQSNLGLRNHGGWIKQHSVSISSLMTCEPASSWAYMHESNRFLASMSMLNLALDRSEKRRVGKECRCRWSSRE